MSKTIKLTLAVELSREYKSHPALAADAIAQVLRARADQVAKDPEMAERLMRQQALTLSFTEDETQQILSLYRIATNEEARITQNATVQRAEAVLLQLFGEKVVEAQS